MEETDKRRENENGKGEKEERKRDIKEFYGKEGRNKEIEKRVKGGKN